MVLVCRYWVWVWLIIEIFFLKCYIFVFKDLINYINEGINIILFLFIIFFLLNIYLWIGGELLIIKEFDFIFVDKLVLFDI